MCTTSSGYVAAPRSRPSSPPGRNEAEKAAWAAPGVPSLSAQRHRKYGHRAFSKHTSRGPSEHSSAPYGVEARARDDETRRLKEQVVAQARDRSDRIEDRVRVNVVPALAVRRDDVLEEPFDVVGVGPERPVDRSGD